MTTEPKPIDDQDVVALAQAEREAGVPDIQTAEAAADVEARKHNGTGSGAPSD